MIISGDSAWNAYHFPISQTSLLVKEKVKTARYDIDIIRMGPWGDKSFDRQIFVLIFNLESNSQGQSLALASWNHQFTLNGITTSQCNPEIQHRRAE